MERLLLQVKCLGGLTWRPVTIACLALVAKVHYDERTYNVDIQAALQDQDFLQLAHVGSMEGALLQLLEWRTTVAPSIYALYFFAMQDAASHSIW